MFFPCFSHVFPQFFRRFAASLHRGLRIRQKGLGGVPGRLGLRELPQRLVRLLPSRLAKLGKFGWSFMAFTNNKTTPVKQPFVKFTTHNLAFTVNFRNSPGKSRQSGWCWLVFSAFTLEFLGCGSINFAYGKLRNISTTEWLTYIKARES
jgi:hypothetical protein